jgi:vancomycin aglycone glucosyltransferase
MRYLRDVLLPQLFQSVSRASGNEDLIVAAGVQVAAASVAERRGVPCVGVTFCPCAIPNDAAPPPTVKTQTLPRWLNQLIWRVGRPVADFALRAPFNAARARLDLPPAVSPVASLAGRAIIMAADRDLAPLGRGAPRDTITTDAWIMNDATVLAADVETFLNGGGPPIYVGFGSMVAADAVPLASHAVSAARATGRRVIIGSGWASLGDRLAASDDVLVVDSAPHAMLFPRVAAVVHHGGAGTTTAAARAGVPQLLLPHILDQYYWAHRIETLGLGPRALAVAHLTPRALSDRVQALVGDTAFARRAAQLGPAIAARNGVDAAVEHLERIAREPSSIDPASKHPDG